MKKAIIFLSVVVAVVIALPALAWAGGWSAAPVPAGSPHTGYATSTSKCKVCHAVHEAENAANTLNGEKLLRSTVTGSCDYCHVGGGFAATQVYNSLPASYTANTGKEHTLSSANTTIPDSGDATGQANPANDYVLAGFNCVSCHAVHGANTILAGVRILKANPGPSTKFTVTNQTGFCADCHDNNYATVKDLVGGPDQTSHYMGAVTSATLASTASDECRSCHSGAGTPTPANNFPHRTDGLDFLKDAYNGGATNLLDSVCLDCHPNVGSQF